MSSTAAGNNKLGKADLHFKWSKVKFSRKKNVCLFSYGFWLIFFPAEFHFQQLKLESEDLP